MTADPGSPISLAPWLSALAAVLLACGGDAGDDAPPAVDEEAGPVSEVGASSPSTMDSTHAVARVEGFAGPEAVRYDLDQDVWFVANFGAEAEEQRDSNGFISRIGPDGEILDLRFMTGTESEPLHMPRGMVIRGDTLWVADADGVHGFDRRTGEHSAFIDFTTHEPGFLNDVAVDGSGTLYVTDTGLGRVYRVAGGTASIAIEDSLTGPPNGITLAADGSRFLLAPWGGGTTLRAWDPATGELEAVAELTGGNFDGVEVVDGRIVVASQADSSIHVIEDGQSRRLIRVPGRPADIGIDTRRGRVAVPYIALNRVDIWPLR